MKTYDQAPQEVHERAIALIRRFYPDLEKVQVRIDILMASTDSEDSHAITHGGYPADAVIKILGPKERAMERGDVEIVIDRDRYEAMTDKERDALLDHELYHLEVKRDCAGQPKRDDHQRPCFKMKKHDFQVGWFHEIARRHGTDSGEVQQAAAFIQDQGQTYFGFAGEGIAPLLASERVAEAAGRLLHGGMDSVSVTSGGTGFKVDATGIHKIDAEASEPAPAQLDEATKLAFADGHLTRSKLQRALRVGYNAACAIVEKLVTAKILGAETDDHRFPLIATAV